MPVVYQCAGRKRGVCDHEADAKWRGRCPQCGRLYDIITKGDPEGPSKKSLAMLGQEKKKYISTGQSEFDRVIGGGLIMGAPYVMSGENGCGKSTLLLTVCGSFATEKNPVLYASGEERAEDVGTLAGRIGVFNEHVEVMGMNGDIYAITERAEEMKAKLLIVDSINTAHLDDVKADEGSPSQMKAVANYLTAWCKREEIPAIVISHVDKEGNMAGPEAIKHLFDTVLELDLAKTYDENGDVDPRTKNWVSFASAKNRHGESEVIAMFERSPTGISWVKKKSKLELV